MMGMGDTERAAAMAIEEASDPVFARGAQTTRDAFANQANMDGCVVSRAAGDRKAYIRCPQPLITVEQSEKPAAPSANGPK